MAAAVEGLDADTCRLIKFRNWFKDDLPREIEPPFVFKNKTEFENRLSSKGNWGDICNMSIGYWGDFLESLILNELIVVPLPRREEFLKDCVNRINLKIEALADEDVVPHQDKWVQALIELIRKETWENRRKVLEFVKRSLNRDTLRSKTMLNRRMQTDFKQLIGNEDIAGKIESYLNSRETLKDFIPRKIFPYINQSLNGGTVLKNLVPAIYKRAGGRLEEDVLRYIQSAKFDNPERLVKPEVKYERLFAFVQTEHYTAITHSEESIATYLKEEFYPVVEACTELKFVKVSCGCSQKRDYAFAFGNPTERECKCIGKCLGRQRIPDKTIFRSDKVMMVLDEKIRLLEKNYSELEELFENEEAYCSAEELQLLGFFDQIYTYMVIYGINWGSLATDKLHYFVRRTAEKNEEGDVLDILVVYPPVEMQPTDETKPRLLHYYSYIENDMIENPDQVPLPEYVKRTMDQVMQTETLSPSGPRDGRRAPGPLPPLPSPTPPAGSSQEGTRRSARLSKPTTFFQAGSKRLKFGPAASLKSCQPKPYQLKLGDIWFGRLIGQCRSEVYSAKFRGQRCVAKVAVLEEEPLLVQELSGEVEIYKRLLCLQGVYIPHLLFAGYYKFYEKTFFLICLEDCGFPTNRSSLTLVQRQRFQKAIKCIHENDVLHRDLKFPNMLVNRNGKAYIIDFGHAVISYSDAEKLEEELQLKTILEETC